MKLAIHLGGCYLESLKLRSNGRWPLLSHVSRIDLNCNPMISSCWKDAGRWWLGEFDGVVGCGWEVALLWHTAMKSLI